MRVNLMARSPVIPAMSNNVSPERASSSPCRRSRSIEILNVALLRLRFRISPAGLGLNRESTLSGLPFKILRQDHSTMLILGLQGSPRKGAATPTSFWHPFWKRPARRVLPLKPSRWPGPGSFPAKAAGTVKRTAPASLPTIPCRRKYSGLLRQADLVVAATPVFFYGISAQLKVLIDRCQTLWSRKYVYKLKDPLAATRKACRFSVAASQGRQLFDGIHLTTKYFFDAIDAQFSHVLVYRGVESKVPSAIRKVWLRTSTRPFKKPSCLWSTAKRSFSSRKKVPAAHPCGGHGPTALRRLHPHRFWGMVSGGSPAWPHGPGHATGRCRPGLSPTADH